MIESFIGIVVGALITWFVADKYYRRASDELRNESTELKDLTILILRGLENAEIVDLNKDVNGKPIGLNIKIKVGTIKVESKTSEPKLRID